MDALTAAQNGGGPGRLPNIELGSRLLHYCQQWEPHPRRFGDLVTLDAFADME